MSPISVISHKNVKQGSLEGLSPGAFCRVLHWVGGEWEGGGSLAIFSQGNGSERGAAS